MVNEREAREALKVIALQPQAKRNQFLSYCTRRQKGNTTSFIETEVFK